MAKRIPNAIVANQDRKRLENGLNDPSYDEKMRNRFRIVLKSDEKKSIKEITEELGINRLTTQKWIERYNEDGYYGLYNTQSYWYNDSMFPYCNMGSRSLIFNMRIVSIYISATKYALVLEVRPCRPEKLVNIGNFISNDTNFYKSISDMEKELEFFWTMYDLIPLKFTPDMNFSTSLSSEMWDLFLKSISKVKPVSGELYYVITSDKTINSKKLGPIECQYYQGGHESFYQKLLRLIEKHNYNKYLINSYIVKSLQAIIQNIVFSKNDYAFLWILRDLYLQVK